MRLPEGAGPHPVVLIIHGGFWYAQYGLDQMDIMAEDFRARGYASWNIEYRRIGHEGGAYPGTLLDVGAAADHLHEVAASYPLDLSRVVALGHSAGGHLALWLAGRHQLPVDSELAVTTPLRLKGVLSLAGANDLHHMWEVRQENSPVVALLGGTPAEFPERYAQASPAQLLPFGVPQVLVHGTEDKHVPVALSTDYLPKAQAAGDSVELIELSGVEHFKVIDPTSEAWPPIVEALRKLIG
nr:alpha/beta hydrolase [Tumebacillus amylolyticus]